jgi:proteasome lid subunit RPN8/RPN11
MLSITDNALREIRAHGETTYPHECCGFLLGGIDGRRRRVVSLLSAENVHEENHARRFLITPKAYMLAERDARARGEDIVGFYHSHPGHPARPSQYDLDHAWPNLSYIIVSIQNGEAADLTSWVLTDDRKAFDGEEIERIA